MVLPKLIADVLRQGNARNVIRNETATNLQTTQQNSKAGRDRSISVKRKNNEDNAVNYGNTRSFASIVTGAGRQTTETISQESIKQLEGNLETIHKLQAELKTGIGTEKNEEEALAYMTKLIETIHLLTKSQETILTEFKKMNESKKPEIIEIETPQAGFWEPAYNATSKRQCLGQGDSGVSQHSQPLFSSNMGGQARSFAEAMSGPVQKPPEDEKTRKLNKFRAAVEESERSTLLVNLNLGKTKVINPETISTNVSLALSKMAAKAEGKQGDVPSNEAIEALDDIISVTKDMRFYGKVTRSVRNARDPTINGSYCTIPVKYEFPDRDTRFYAEEIFRNTCKAQVSTPYPMILREAIRQIIETVKEDHPDNLVKVLVDTRRMVFKVSRRPRGEDWIKLPKVIDIPVECQEIDAREVPTGFQVTWPSSPTRQSRKDRHEDAENRSRSPEPRTGDQKDPG